MISSKCLLQVPFLDLNSKRKRFTNFIIGNQKGTGSTNGPSLVETLVVEPAPLFHSLSVAMSSTENSISIFPTHHPVSVSSTHPIYLQSQVVSAFQSFRPVAPFFFMLKVQFLVFFV